MRYKLLLALAVSIVASAQAQKTPQDVTVISLPMTADESAILNQSFIATHWATLPPECQKIEEPFETCTFNLAYTGTEFAGFGLECPAKQNVSPFCKEVLNSSYAMPESLMQFWSKTYCKKASEAFRDKKITLTNVPDNDFCKLVDGAPN